MFYESSDDESEDDDVEVENMTYLQSGAMSTRSHFSSLSHIDAADVYGVIPLSRLEIKVQKESRVVRALKSGKKFMVKYFFCQKFLEKEVANCRDDVSESINESEQNIPTSSAETTTQNTPSTHQRQQNVPGNANAVMRGRRTFNSVSKVDKFSRVVFPLLYLGINLIYWVFYLSRSQRK